MKNSARLVNHQNSKWPVKAAAAKEEERGGRGEEEAEEEEESELLNK